MYVARSSAVVCAVAVMVILDSVFEKTSKRMRGRSNDPGSQQYFNFKPAMEARQTRKCVCSMMRACALRAVGIVLSDCTTYNLPSGPQVAGDDGGDSVNTWGASGR